MADPSARYNGVELDQRHRTAMELGCAALLRRLTEHHPRIVAALVERAKKGKQA